MHPPIPWETTQAGEIIAEVEPGQWAIIATMSRAVSPEMGHGAARHAVRCVNTHPRLVEALRGAADVLGEVMRGSGRLPGPVAVDVAETINRARALLAEIERDGGGDHANHRPAGPSGS